MHHVDVNAFKDITNLNTPPSKTGHALAQLFVAMLYKLEGRVFDSRWCHWKFSCTYIFGSHDRPGVNSSSNRNKYQKYFLRVKAAGVRRADKTYLLPMLTVLKSGSLNLLEPSGSVQACNAIAWLLPSRGVVPGLNIISLCTNSLKASRWVRSDCVEREFGGVEEERRETKSCKYRCLAVLSMLHHTRRIFPHVLLLSASRHFPSHNFIFISIRTFKYSPKTTKKYDG
jgi:hypothetical protein